MCHPKPGHHGTGPGSCCSLGSECGPGFRHFFSKTEVMECLESYRDHLKKELAGLEERIKDMKKE